jgi:mRNA interferase YafQ
LIKRISRTTQFKKDVRRLRKRGTDLEKLKTVLSKLVAGEKLSQKYRDHLLVGQYKGSRECHIEPDWLLIYESTEDEIILVRTGTHSDLFQ